MWFFAKFQYIALSSHIDVSHIFYRDLTLLQERQQKKCEKFEAAVHEDEALFFQEMYTLMEQNKVHIENYFSYLK